MKVADVMTSEVKTIRGDAAIKEAATVMVKSGVSGLPVVDDNLKLIGIITEADFVAAEANRSWGRQRRRLLANLLGEAKPHDKKLVEEVMTKDPHTIDRGSTVTEAARKMVDHGVKRLPVVRPDGTLEGIISRADVMSAFARDDAELRDEIVDEVVVGTLQLDPATIKVTVDDGTVTLEGSVPSRTEARLLEELVVRVEGVIAVETNVDWEYDDTQPGSGVPNLM